VPLTVVCTKINLGWKGLTVEIKKNKKRIPPLTINGWVTVSISRR